MQVSRPILAIDTTSSVCSVAFGSDGLYESVSGSYPMSHSRDIVVLIELLLKKQCCWYGDLGAVVVVTGPGSFTGVRVGITAAKAIECATGVRLVGVDSFSIYRKVISNHVLNSSPAGGICNDSAENELIKNACVVLSVSRNGFIVGKSVDSVDFTDRNGLRGLIGKCVVAGDCLSVIREICDNDIVNNTKPIAELCGSIGGELLSRGLAQHPVANYAMALRLNNRSQT